MNKVIKVLKNGVEKFKGFSTKKKVIVVASTIFVLIVGSQVSSILINEHRTKVMLENRKAENKIEDNESNKVSEPSVVNPQEFANKEKSNENSINEEDKQDLRNSLVRSNITNVMKETYGDYLIDIKKQDNINIYCIAGEGISIGVQLEQTKEEKKYMEDSLKKLSKGMEEAAKAGGSNEEFQIWLMNDMNTDRVLEIFVNGECLDFTKQ